MIISTKNKITPVAERMAKGSKPADSEIQLLRDAAAEVQDVEFRDLLRTVGNETTLRLRRQAGRKLLNKIKFATGARRKNDLPPDNPRPEKVKAGLKQGKFLK